ncbi:hypothetical protein ACFFKU_04600 [Kineococcus gynurae]|uniref:Uncharacterized protein n=1 Tax=Kineococcus gynurae TaxID=452979 RepID=A0ABV5LRC3_9ACTN
MIRPLRPARLAVLDSGIWLLDHARPVAAILDPTTSQLRHLVSWAEQPPPPPPRTEPTVAAGPDVLWIQHGDGSALLRVGPTGVEDAVWTDGLGLRGAAGAAAWCASAPPAQEFVESDRVPVGPVVRWGAVARVDRDGSVHRCVVDAPVAEVVATDEGAWVGLDTAPGTLRPLGAGSSEVLWSRRWLFLPAAGAWPAALQVAEGRAVAPVRASQALQALRWSSRFLDEQPEAGDLLPTVPLGGRDWTLGRDPVDDRVRARRLGPDRVDVLFPSGCSDVLAVALLADDVLVATLGDPVGDGETGLAPHRLRADATLRALPAPPAVDVADHGWPLGPRPLAAASYVRQTLAALRLDLGADPGVDNAVGSVVRVELRGDWPTTVVECTFALRSHPGVRLRRSWSLFDEQGQISPPLWPGVFLREDVETRRLPPPSAARDGVLDV